MGYYTISISPASQDMTTIVTEFGKFVYNCLPMGMCTSGDIFQAKVDELLGDVDGIKIYIDDILFLSEYCFIKHIEHLRMLFGKLCAAGLKLHAPKFSFGLKEIPCLSYVIKREGIKPYPNKVQGFMDIWRPTITIEAIALMGMVQY